MISGPDLSQNLHNPFFAKRYYAELVDRLTQMQIREDPLLKDSGKMATVERVKNESIGKEQDADNLMRGGVMGAFLPAGEETIGQALLLDGTLYLDTTFAAYPGINLHLYMSDVVDPRDDTFPDATALDLGVLQNPYGFQQFALPEDQKDHVYRTVALWDAGIGRLYSFVQLSK